MKNKSNVFAIGLLAFVLVMSVGYAMFSETLNIGGTAATTGNFDVEISNAVVTTETGSTGATILVSEDKNSVTLSAPALEYPGSSVVYTITITNNGNIPTKLKNITETGLTDDPNVTISYDGISTVDDILNKNDSKTFTITVTWNQDSTAASSNVEFQIDLNYEQAV
ncbi:MAG: hypothetical protein V8Q75_02600 [Bacilli bacterium]